MNAYIPIIAMVVLALLFVVVMIGLNIVFSPKRYNKVKYDAYECGVQATATPVGGGRVPVHYYVIAMLYIVFDIEIVFLYPWAVSFDMLGAFAVIEMLLFMATVFVAYFYVFRRGGLDWE